MVSTATLFPFLVSFTLIKAYLRFNISLRFPWELTSGGTQFAALTQKRTRVGPDTRQCRIIRTDVRYSATKTGISGKKKTDPAQP